MTSQRRTIVVVCRGNIARSPFAEVIIRRELVELKLIDRFEVLSRGVQGTTVDPTPVKYPNITYYEQLYLDAKPALDRFKVDLSHHQSSAMDAVTANRASIILAMDGEVKDKLERLFPEHRNKMYLFSEIADENQNIKDPEAVISPSGQNHVFVEIAEKIVCGFPKLIAMAEKQ